MRKVININENWEFIKENIVEEVNLPHCWNGVDGQGASEKYYRGRCVYEKTIPSFDGRVYLEFCGVNTVCEVFVNRTQNFEPKSATKRLEDGTLVSAPLEDLAPFLLKEELKANMLIPLVEEN